MGGTGLSTLEIMKKIPHFAGKNSLSLTELQALADAVPPPCPQVQPAATTRGRVQYDNADYNLATLTADECSGTAARPDSPGMLASVDYAAADAPYIDSGNLVLPLAHDYSPEDSSLPDESVTGGISSINVVEDLKRAQINRGDIQLPLAQSAWPQTAEGAMYTPGLVYGVQYDPVDDACEGAVLPRIDQGIIHLPAGGGGGGGDDTEPSGCSCVPAQYTGSISSLGLCRSVEFEENLESCLITNGRIRLPRATSADECTGTVGGVCAVQYTGAVTTPAIQNGVILLPAPTEPAYFPAGVYDAVNARHLTWADLKTSGVVTLSRSTQYGFGIKAFMLGDSLSLFIEE